MESLLFSPSTSLLIPFINQCLGRESREMLKDELNLLYANLDESRSGLELREVIEAIQEGRIICRPDDEPEKKGEKWFLAPLIFASSAVVAWRAVQDEERPLADFCDFLETYIIDPELCPRHVALFIKALDVMKALDDAHYSPLPSVYVLKVLYFTSLLYSAQREMKMHPSRMTRFNASHLADTNADMEAYYTDAEALGAIKSNIHVAGGAGSSIARFFWDLGEQLCEKEEEEEEEEESDD